MRACQISKLDETPSNVTAQEVRASRDIASVCPYIDYVNIAQRKDMTETETQTQSQSTDVYLSVRHSLKKLNVTLVG